MRLGQGSMAGLIASLAAAHDGWLRGRVFRHGSFDEAAEMIAENIGPRLGRSHLGRVLRPLRQRPGYRLGCAR